MWAQEGLDPRMEAMENLLFPSEFPSLIVSLSTWPFEQACGQAHRRRLLTLNFLNDMSSIQVSNR